METIQKKLGDIAEKLKGITPNGDTLEDVHVLHNETWNTIVEISQWKGALEFVQQVNRQLKQSQSFTTPMIKKAEEMATEVERIAHHKLVSFILFLFSHL